MVGIYTITNLINGNFYIGSSTDLQKRKLRHFRELKKGNHPNKHLQNAFNKYGKDSLKFDVKKEVFKNKLMKEEQKLLDNFIGNSKCYNICKTAGSPFVKGRIKTKEHREKLSAATSKYYQEHPEARLARRNERLGTKLSEETKRKLCEVRARGIQHHNAKLNEDKVRLIRKSYIPREMSFQTLADKFKVDKKTIIRIVKNKTWTHVL